MKTAEQKWNRIPRNFNKILGTSLVKTNLTEPGDKLEVWKDFAGYHATNLRTGARMTMFPSHLRNGQLFRIESVE